MPGLVIKTSKSRLVVEHETVHLSFWKWVSTILLDWVLGSENEVWFLHDVGFAGDGGLVLLHDLEKSGLGLWGSTVDFVGEDDLGEDRTLLEVGG